MPPKSTLMDTKNEKERKMKKTILAAALMLTMAAGQSYGFSINFNSQNMNTALGDQSGKSSPYGVDATNTALSGYAIETFDQRGSAATTVQVPKSGGGFYTVNVPAGAGFNTLDPTNEMISYSGGFGIQRGSTGYAAAPAGDSTFFAYAPGQGNTSAQIGVDYTNFIQSFGVRISYLGLYYGSIDTYNNLEFYSGANKIHGSGILADGVVTGQEILTAMNGTSGNQFQPGSNVYVNLFFDANDPIFTSFRFNTSGVAFEADNMVAGFTPVPEPGTMALLGFGMLGLAIFGKRRMNKEA